MTGREIQKIVHVQESAAKKEEVLEWVAGQELVHLPHEAVLAKCPDVYLKLYHRKSKYLFLEALLKMLKIFVLLNLKYQCILLWINFYASNQNP